MKPKRKDYQDEREYWKALALYYEQRAAECLMKANEIRETRLGLSWKDPS